VRKSSFIITVAIMTVALVGAAFASDGKTDTTKAEAKAKELKQQTNCPVMGGKIDSTAYTDIQGQRVYHCCPACSAALKKDPDKYFKKAAEEGILFENIQTFCPVSGKTLAEKETYVDYQGRRVYFCCPNCIPTFEKDPQKYLGILDAPAKPQEDMKDMPMMKDHKSHEQGDK
jgi:YHS domain-containing protein